MNCEFGFETQKNDFLTFYHNYKHRHVFICFPFYV